MLRHGKMCLKPLGDQWSSTLKVFAFLGKCPKSRKDLFSNAHRVTDVDTIWGMPKEMLTRWAHSPASRKQKVTLGLLPTMSPHTSHIFCLFSQSTVVLLDLIENQRLDGIIL
jgi:hypothetical protein